MEAINFSKNLSKFGVVIGISPDSPEKHCKFADKHNLKVILLSDESKKVLELFDVWKEKSMYGRKYWGVVRTTLLINPSGNVAFRWDKVKVPGHIEEVLKKLEELKNV